MRCDRKMLEPRNAFRFFATIFLTGLCLLIVVGEVRACLCFEAPTQAEAFAESGAVFSGKLLSAQEVKRYWDRGGWPWGDDVILLEFEVYSVWKGRMYETTFMVTASFDGYCRKQLTPGVEYLVYSVDSESIHLCNRALPLPIAEEDLMLLGQGKAPEPGSMTPMPTAVVPTTVISTPTVGAIAPTADPRDSTAVTSTSTSETETIGPKTRIWVYILVALVFVVLTATGWVTFRRTRE